MSRTYQGEHNELRFRNWNERIQKQIDEVQEYGEWDEVAEPKYEAQEMTTYEIAEREKWENYERENRLGAI